MLWYSWCWLLWMFMIRRGWIIRIFSGSGVNISSAANIRPKLLISNFSRIYLWWQWASTDQVFFKKNAHHQRIHADPVFLLCAAAGTQEAISQWHSEKLLYFFVTKLTLGNKAGWVLSFQSFNFSFIYSSRKKGGAESRGHEAADTPCLCKKSIQQRAQSCLLFYFLRYEPE